MTSRLIHHQSCAQLVQLVTHSPNKRELRVQIRSEASRPCIQSLRTTDEGQIARNTCRCLTPCQHHVSGAGRVPSLSHTMVSRLGCPSGHSENTDNHRDTIGDTRMRAVRDGWQPLLEATKSKSEVSPTVDRVIMVAEWIHDQDTSKMKPLPTPYANQHRNIMDSLRASTVSEDSPIRDVRDG